MARRKRDDAMTPEELRAEMLRGIQQRQTVAFFDACGKKLADRNQWDILSMRDIREACLLQESIAELRTSCAARLRAGDAKTARTLLMMRRDSETARAAILDRWNLLPPKKRGRPAEETPEDLRQNPEDDGWDTFGMDADPDE